MRRSDATDPAPPPEAGHGEPEAGHGEPEELLIEEISIDGMCGVY